MIAASIERVARGIDFLGLVGGWIAAAAVLGILGLVTLEVTLRTAFGMSTQVSDEMGGYLNVAVIYFGLAYALRSGTFVRVEPVYKALKGTVGLLVRWLIVLVSAGYVGVTSWYMVGFVQSNYRMGIASTSFSETPLWIPQLAVIIGSTMLVLQFVAFALRGCRDVP